MRHPPWVAPVFNAGEMVQKSLQAKLLETCDGAMVMAGTESEKPAWNYTNQQYQNSINPSSQP